MDIDRNIYTESFTQKIKLIKILFNKHFSRKFQLFIEIKVISNMMENLFYNKQRPKYGKIF